MIARARIKKIGGRWHWSIVVRSSVDHGHVYQGHEPTWKLALVMLEYTWNCHKMEWELPAGIRRGDIIAMKRVDKLAPVG